MTTSRPRIAIVGDHEGVQAGSESVARLGDRAEIAVHRDPIPPDEVARTLAGQQIVIAVRERTAFPAEVLEALDDLEMISQSGNRAAHVDLEVAARRGVLVAAGPASPSAGPLPSVMPELVFGMLFALTRDLVHVQHRMRAGEWPSSLGRAMHGTTFGVLGLGRHGRAVADAARAFGMRVVAWGPTLTGERAAEAGVERLDELDDLMARADVLSVHLKLSDLSRGLVDARRLDLLPEGAIVINTARGAILDEDALAERLADGRIAGAGLDVFVTEPLPADHPLRRLDNVVLTPHVGFTVDRELGQFAVDTVAHVEAYLDGVLSRSVLLNPDAAVVDRERVGAVTD